MVAGEDTQRSDERNGLISRKGQQDVLVIEHCHDIKLHSDITSRGKRNLDYGLGLICMSRVCKACNAIVDCFLGGLLIPKRVQRLHYLLTRAQEIKPPSSEDQPGAKQSSHQTASSPSSTLEPSLYPSAITKILSTLH